MTKAIHSTSEPQTAAAAWHLALSDYEAKVASLEAYNGIHNEAAEAFFADREGQSDAFRAIEVEYDARCEVVYEARTKLMATPVPDTASLLFKIDTLLGLMREDDAQDTPAVEAIRADVARLIEGA